MQTELNNRMCYNTHMNLRLNKLKDHINRKGLDAILISSTPNIIYLSSFYSFTDIEREGYLLITKNGNFIITDARYKGMADKIKNFKFLEISSQNSLKNVLSKIFNPKEKTIGFEPNDLRVQEFMKFKKIFKKFIPVDLSALRIKKDESEIKKIKSACKIGDEAFSFILKKIKPGISEKELAFELELFIKRKDAELSFPTIIAYGKNSAVPHHTSGNQRLKTKDIILLDFGVKKDNYCSDMTRVVFLGKATPEQKKVYQTVLEANKRSIEFLNSYFINHKSISAKAVDKVARNYIIKAGFPTIPHSLGHGVGLQIHESPRLSLNSKDVLEEGMVFSIEPGIYLPAGRQGNVGWGGIRIEDLVTIRRNKLEIQTLSAKKLIEL